MILTVLLLTLLYLCCDGAAVTLCAVCQVQGAALVCYQTRF